MRAPHVNVRRNFLQESARPHALTQRKTNWLILAGGIIILIMFVCIITPTMALRTRDRNHQSAVTASEFVIFDSVGVIFRTAIINAFAAARAFEGYLVGTLTILPNLTQSPEQRLQGQSFPRFYTLAEAVAETMDDVSVMVLSPGGVILESYPIETASVGRDLFSPTDPIMQSSPTPVQTMLGGTYDVVGPSVSSVAPLVGRWIITVRQPVYNLTAPPSFSVSEFWGFVSVLINVSGVMDDHNMLTALKEKNVDYLLFGTASTGQRYVVESSRTFRNEAEIDAFIEDGVGGSVFLPGINFSCSIQSRSRKRFLSSTSTTLIVCVTVLGCLALFAIASFVVVCSNREYDAIAYAPKLAPFAVLTVSMTASEQMWMSDTMNMSDVVDRLSSRLDKKSEAFHAYCIGQQYAFSRSYVARSADALLHMVFALLEDLQEHPALSSESELATLTRLRSTARGANAGLLAAALHWCTTGTVSIDPATGECLYSGAELQWGASLVARAVPGTVTLTETARSALSPAVAAPLEFNFLSVECGPGEDSARDATLAAARPPPVKHRAEGADPAAHDVERAKDVSSSSSGEVELFTVTDPNCEVLRAILGTVVPVADSPAARTKSALRRNSGSSRSSSLNSSEEDFLTDGADARLRPFTQRRRSSRPREPNTDSDVELELHRGNDGAHQRSPLGVSGLQRQFRRGGGMGERDAAYHTDPPAHSRVPSYTPAAHRVAPGSGAAVHGNPLLLSSAAISHELDRHTTTITVMPADRRRSKEAKTGAVLVRTEDGNHDGMPPLHSGALLEDVRPTAIQVAASLSANSSFALGNAQPASSPYGRKSSNASSTTPLRRAQLMMPANTMGLAGADPGAAAAVTTTGPTTLMVTTHEDDAIARLLLDPHVPAWLDGALHVAFDHQAIAFDITYAEVRVLVYFFYCSTKLLFRPLATVERENIYKRLITAFGVPQQGILEHLAARCVIRHMQQHEEAKSLLWDYHLKEIYHRESADGPRSSPSPPLRVTAGISPSTISGLGGLAPVHTHDTSTSSQATAVPHWSSSEASLPAPPS